MNPRTRKLALTTHILASVGWFGAAAAFEALAVAGLNSPDALKVRAAYLAMPWTVWFIIIPLAVSALITGLTLALGTKWGLLRHYWILVKFLINTLALLILLLHTRLVDRIAQTAANRPLLFGDLRGLRIQLVAIGGAALAALMLATTLAVFKPRGQTGIDG